MIYTSGDFNWLKNCEKQSKIIKYFTPSKFCVCVCVCVCVCMCVCVCVCIKWLISVLKHGIMLEFLY